MFFFTAKLNKRKILTVVLALLLIAAAIIFLVSRSAAETSASKIVLKNNKERIAYLGSLGWKVKSDPLDEQNIVIPKNFDDVYEEYNELQLSQGFDLSGYAGLEATRYTYEVLNYPGGEDPVVADIIIYRNRLIAGDVQSAKLDGFMHGLQFPETDKKP